MSAASRYASQSGRNICCANCTSQESKGRLIEPVVPSTHSCSPRTPSKPASVITKLGTPNRLYRNPYSAPITTPAATAATTASHSGHDHCTKATARIAAASPAIDPTERSISPSNSTSTMPTAIVPIAAICRVRFTMLALERKFGLIREKTTQMTASPTITGSDPRSPLRTRAPKARSAPATPRSRTRRSSWRSAATVPSVTARSDPVMRASPERGPDGRCATPGGSPRCRRRR